MIEKQLIHRKIIIKIKKLKNKKEANVFVLFVEFIDIWKIHLLIKKERFIFSIH
jgi:hypothetical protein